MIRAMRIASKITIKSVRQDACCFIPANLMAVIQGELFENGLYKEHHLIPKYIWSADLCVVLSTTHSL